MTRNALSTEDFDRLEALLDSPIFTDGTLRLDEIQAFLCAVVSAPTAVAREDWLAEILGPGGEASPERVELEGLLGRLHDEIGASLAQRDGLVLILYPLDETSDEDDYGSWADAYIHGCGLAGDWFGHAGRHADDLAELLEPLFLLNGGLREDVEAAGERWFSPQEEARVMGEAADDLPDIVQALYDFWQSKAGFTAVRHEAPKVGRNDPCPCGSGKKFKQCCGRPNRLN